MNCISRFEEFASTMVSLPDTFAVEKPLPRALQMKSDGNLSIFYAPFDHVTTTARIVLVGITPGRVQALAAIAKARDCLSRSASPEKASAEAKSTASFSGPMRGNLIAMLDHVGVASRLGLQTTASLWSSHTHLVHFTSALRYPVFEDGKNYSGSGIVSRQLLREQIESYFAHECRALTGALFVPLGKAAQAACDYATGIGALSSAQILRGLPHPSGANAERIAYFLGRKDRASLSVKTRPATIEAGRLLANQCVEAWA